VIDPVIPEGYRIFNQISVPGVDYSRVWNFTLGSWETDNTKNVLPKVADSASGKYLSGLQSVTARAVSGSGAFASVAVMIADSTGLYEVVIPDVNNPTLAPARWMLPEWAFKAIKRAGPGVSTENGSKFFPTYARRLDDDSVILVNGYSGFTVGNPFAGIAGTIYRGEILQIDGSINTTAAALLPPTAVDTGFTVFAANLGFGTRSIQMRLGPIEGTRGLVMPVFADRR
jgi:hypothetical protein